MLKILIVLSLISYVRGNDPCFNYCKLSKDVLKVVETTSGRNRPTCENITEKIDRELILKVHNNIRNSIMAKNKELFRQTLDNMYNISYDDLLETEAKCSLDGCSGNQSDGCKSIPYSSFGQNSVVYFVKKDEPCKIALEKSIESWYEHTRNSYNPKFLPHRIKRLIWTTHTGCFLKHYETDRGKVCMFFCNYAIKRNEELEYYIDRPIIIGTPRNCTGCPVGTPCGAFVSSVCGNNIDAKWRSDDYFDEEEDNTDLSNEETLKKWCSVGCIRKDRVNAVCKYKGKCFEGNGICHVVPPSQFKEHLVYMHNEIRSLFATGSHVKSSHIHVSNMRALTWDDELAIAAECMTASMDECKKTKSIDNLVCPTTPRFPHYVGINQKWFKSGGYACYVNYPNAVLHWFEEFTNSSRSALDHIILNYEPNQLMRHFTQMVWANSYRIGCSMRQVELKHEFGCVLICLYGPGGNRRGMSAIKLGTPCSQCPKGTYCSSNFTGLCASQEKVRVSLIVLVLTLSFLMFKL